MVQPHAKLILLFAYRPIIRLILNNNYFYDRCASVEQKFVLLLASEYICRITVYRL